MIGAMALSELLGLHERHAAGAPGPQPAALLERPRRRLRRPARARHLPRLERCGAARLRRACPAGRRRRCRAEVPARARGGDLRVLSAPAVGDPGAGDDADAGAARACQLSLRRSRGGALVCGQRPCDGAPGRGRALFHAGGPCGLRRAGQGFPACRRADAARLSRGRFSRGAGAAGAGARRRGGSPGRRADPRALPAGASGAGPVRCAADGGRAGGCVRGGAARR